jgi:tetratricopeptide (TPR) repeat protein
MESGTGYAGREPPFYLFLLYPDISEYCFRRGTAYYLLEEYDEALFDLNKALESNPGNK